MENIRKLQLIELYMFLEFKGICDKYHIPYFLVGGSLLGAVRHHGFIPWDDDIDVGMCRKDYLRFISICKSELSDEFFLQTIDTDLNYASVIPRMLLESTKYLHIGVVGLNTHDGIWLDIFPYDNIPSNRGKQFMYSIKSWALRAIFYAKFSEKLYERCTGNSYKKKINLIKRCEWKVCVLVSHLYSKEQLRVMLNTHFQKYNSKNTKYMISSVGESSYKKECIAYDKISSQIEMNFEGVNVLVPVGYHDYLTNIYGPDYMDLPPEEKRVTHNVVEIDFGKYGNIETILKEKYGLTFAI